MQPPAPFHNISSLSARDQLLFSGFGRGPIVRNPFNVAHHAFEAIVDAHPSALALRVHKPGQNPEWVPLTYGTLERRANALANRLILAGLQPGSRVVCAYSRSIEMVVAILAVLKAGGQYVPLDGNVVTEETMAHVLKDSGTGFVLCLRKYSEKVEAAKQPSVRVVELDGYGGAEGDDRLGEVEDVSRPNVKVGPQDGAYVIYTSGTTGKPKGVDVAHGGVCSTLLNEPSKLRITVGSRVAQLLSVSFDMGAWEILGTMMNGGTLHIRSNDWRAVMAEVDTVIATPSVLGKFRQADFPNVKNIAVGGEPCPYPTAEEWAPHCHFLNVCGPTEITILNTAHPHKAGGPLTIGKPNPNTTLYILDDNEQPCKIGEPGLMWCGGKGVSRGYVGLPELTAGRYKPDKFTLDGSLMFNTGDLGRWLEDGSLEHLGRKDEQVKIKGFRVELDGVSAAIERFPTVSKACALLIDQKLFGFYAAPAKVDEVSLKREVADLLPFYAVPEVWHYLPVIELTQNGKVDKRILKGMVENGTVAKSVASRTPSTQTLPPPVYQKSGAEVAVALRHKESDTTLSSSKASSMVDMKNNRSGDAEKGHVIVTEAKMQVDMTSIELKPEEAEEIDRFPLPDKNGFHGERWLRHRFFSTYRRLFALIFLGNLGAFIAIVHKAVSTQTSLNIMNLSTAVAANLMVAVLMRQEHVVNLLYWMCATFIPLSAPLSIRRLSARIFHLGGVHSGCAVAAVGWWVVFTASATINFSNGNTDYPVNGGMIILTYLILLLLLTIVTMAHPSLRASMHDQFEWTHRFFGWLALALVWAHAVVSIDSLTNAPLGATLLASPSFWLLLATTISIALPWLSLRRVKVRPEPLSRHAVRLHFDWCTPTSGKGVRVSDRPLAEWHAFAAINEPDVAGFSVIVSRAGDWTGRTIDRPPRTLWTRGVPAAGVFTIAPLFRKLVLVATGSGIGPCLPVIMEGRVPVRVLWSTPHPVETFGQGVMDKVLAADPDAVIWNTRTQGKPDLVAIAYRMLKESGAEAVGVISNKKVTEELVYGLEKRGVPAFGPVFDS